MGHDSATHPALHLNLFRIMGLILMYLNRTHIIVSKLYAKNQGGEEIIFNKTIRSLDIKNYTLWLEKKLTKMSKMCRRSDKGCRVFF